MAAVDLISVLSLGKFKCSGTELKIASLLAEGKIDVAYKTDYIRTRDIFQLPV